MYVYFSLKNMVFFSVFILQYIAHTARRQTHPHPHKYRYITTDHFM